MNLLSKDKIIQMLGLATRARKVTLGTDAFLIGISKIKLVFISSDASENTKEKVKNKCEYYKIKYTESLSTTELFKATGKQNLMVLGICDNGFAKSINNLLKEDVKNESK